MAGKELSQHIRQGVEALRSDEGTEPVAGCRAGDLKGLLNAIVDQISEADRRHTRTLEQVQDRLASISREAEAIKPRVPESFAAAFERIEAGMAELSSRITETADVTSPVPVQTMSEQNFPAWLPHAGAIPAAEKPQHFDPPAALRSASDQMMAATRRRDEEASRAQAGVDTFDVIESSLPGNPNDPWDRDSAEALSGLYDSGTAGYPATSATSNRSLTDIHAMTPSTVSHTSPVAGSSIDQTWLEHRFSDVAKRIDESLSDIRPDQGFFALGQRVDQLEQHFSGLFDGIATRTDVEGVRLIEAHVSELAGHLENAHQQLMRLDVIEDQLIGIAAKLDDVHMAAAAASENMYSTEPQPAIEVHAIARIAAEAAAAHVGALPSRDVGEMRDMLKGFISESRQGEENTSALLDTLQQAMIRLLDRVDSIELNSLNRSHSPAASQEYVREPARFSSDASRVSAPSYTEDHHEGSLDAAVAAVASAKSLSSPYAPVTDGHELPGAMPERMSAPATQEASRPSTKLRQDFVAEARRAKMRLAAESDGDGASIVIPRPELEIPSSVAQSKPMPRGGKSAPASVSADGKPEAQPILTPKLRVMALATLLALGSGWYAMHHFQSHESPVTVAADPIVTDPTDPPPPAPSTVGDAGVKTGKAEASATSGAANSAAPSSATPVAPAAPAKRDSSQLNLDNGTQGEIVSGDLTVGSTTVPLYGVAVDSEKPMSPADVARAKRQQAIAAVSTQLGQAALQNPDALAIPASLQPDAASAGATLSENGMTSVAKSNMSQSSALDMPPATVGPLSLRLAAANGDPSAEFEVGARLAEGKGTAQNFKDAAKWYQRSASQGFAQAQYRLGTLYERGLGLTKDMARAGDWYKRAAEQGNIKAMHNLAVLSANSSGASPDYATAAQWFEEAAERGLSDSQFNLAVLHENGLGVEQDLPVAFKWLSLAAKSGDKEAIRRRDILQGKLTAEQLTKAEGLIASWKAKTTDQAVNDPRKAGEAWKTNPANGVNG